MKTPDKKSEPIFRQNGGRRPGAGRPKGAKNTRTIEIETEAKKYAGDALKALVSIVRKKSASEGARISAAVALLDRAYGRPRQMLGHDGGAPGTPIAVEVAELRAKLGSRIAGLASRLLPTEKPVTNGKNGKH